MPAAAGDAVARLSDRLGARPARPAAASGHTAVTRTRGRRWPVTIPDGSPRGRAAEAGKPRRRGFVIRVVGRQHDQESAS